MIDLESPVQSLKGIGPKTAQLFAKLNIKTVGDLLKQYPRSYERFEAPVSVEEAFLLDFAAVQGYIASVPTVRSARQMKVIICRLRGQGNKTIRLTWFNMTYLVHTLKPGKKVVVRGKITGSVQDPVMEQPQIFTIEEYEKKMHTLMPIYPLTAGLSNSTISKAIAQIFEEGFERPKEIQEIGAEIRKKYQLMEWEEALYQIHFPKNEEVFQTARKRLVFDEFYQFLSQIEKQKEQYTREKNHFVLVRQREVENLIQHLPYQLTGAQSRVIEQIRQDMSGMFLMNRMVQGDVGSGKTIVAVLAMYECALCGYQSAMMAPTEVLAVQHYRFMTRLFEENHCDMRVELLTGSMTAAQKRAAYQRIVQHEVDMIVGTHALIQENVQYDQLALVITDEQHRFGVNQRKALMNKGRTPNVIVMSATPIPRSLAIMIYGDLDLSILDEKPANRLPIKNCVVDKSYRLTAWKFIRDKLKEGRQAYVICPMVEETEGMEGENVVDYAKKLKDWMPEYSIDYLHGKMKEAEKEACMGAFGRGELQVLVSTTVIEVGIDVANATVILIENADRFGLAQLHQLRGRVGRGEYQSYCIMINTSPTKNAKKRLEILNNSNDGFEIASKDLQLRGPGDFFGIRQSGMLEFDLGDVYQDADVLKLAAEAVRSTI
ncbi:MAG: ATP-dependent DNA helicase RecG [Lachnospiraceae bacterium]